jgi:hypothetical protein
MAQKQIYTVIQVNLSCDFSAAVLPDSPDASNSDHSSVDGSLERLFQNRSTGRGGGFVDVTYCIFIVVVD